MSKANEIPKGASHFVKNPVTEEISYWSKRFSHFNQVSEIPNEEVYAWYWWNGKDWQKDIPARWNPQPF